MQWFGPRGFAMRQSKNEFRPALVSERDGVEDLDENGSVVAEKCRREDEPVRLDDLARVVNAAPAAAPHLAGMEEGWTQSLERLGRLVTT